MGSHGDFSAALDAHGITREEYAPLFLRMLMKYASRPWRDLHDRKHGVFSGEDPRRDAWREHSREALRRIVEVVKLTHCSLR
jgi:hypothetical protein